METLSSTVTIVPSLWPSIHHPILQNKPMAGGKLGPTLTQAEKDLNNFEAGYEVPTLADHCI